MTSTRAPVRVAFFGSYAWSVDYLAALHASPLVEVVVVVTRHDDHDAAGARTFATPVTEWCEASAPAVPLRKPRSLKDEGERASLAAHGPEIVVSAGYSLLLPEALYRGVARAGINVHPSLLPRYRGADPVRRALLDGAGETGVSLHLLTEAFDAGPLLWQRAVTLDPAWNAGDVLHALAREACPVLPQVVWDFASGRLEPFAQSGQPTYAPALEGRETELRGSDSVDRARRLFRALAPYRHPVWVDGVRRAEIVEMGCEPGATGAGCETLVFADGELCCRLEDGRP